MMVASVRQTDLVARIGGDEFAILLDHADEQNACEAAARLAQQVAGCEFCFEGRCLPLSIAIGFTPIQTGDSPVAVLDRADEAMYREKDAA
jgi:diguanylate cyclase (GGDEF)-like protein